MKRRILTERNLVVVLFVMVLVIFSMAQEDTKKIEQMYIDTNSSSTSSLDKTDSPQVKNAQVIKTSAESFSFAKIPF